MKDPDFIYLEPEAPNEQGRHWCEDNVWCEEQYGKPAVKYIRFDLHEQEIKELKRVTK